MCSILIERHRVRRARIHLGTTTLYFGVPCLGRAWLGLAIQSSQELQCQLRSLLYRQAKKIFEHIGRGHSESIAFWRCLAGSTKRTDVKPS